MKLITTNIKIPQIYYDEYISLGNRCTSAASLQKQELKKHVYPFDWIISNPTKILNLLKTDFADFYPINDKIMVGYYNKKLDLGFGHFSAHSHFENHETFNVLIKWLYEVFKSNRIVLFLYTTECYITMKEYRNEEQKHYDDLIGIINFFKESYPNFKFHVLAIHTNVKHENNIEELTNLTIQCDDKYLIDSIDSEIESQRIYHALIDDIINNQTMYCK